MFHEGKKEINNTVVVFLQISSLFWTMIKTDIQNTRESGIYHHTEKQKVMALAFPIRETRGELQST